MNDFAIAAIPTMKRWASKGRTMAWLPICKGFPMSYDSLGFPVVAARRLSIATVLILSWLTGVVVAADPKTEKYSPEVVAKAEKILEEHSLRRGGKQIQAIGTTVVTRGITGLSREKRELRLMQKDWDAGGVRLNLLRQQLQQLKQQRADLSLQLARLAGDTAANNRIVGLLNVNNNQMEQVVAEREKTKANMTAKRAVLSDAESKYAEKILVIRKQFNLLESAVQEALADDQVAIALRVMNVNFGTPTVLTADQILAALNKRVERVEQEVFSENIPLQVENRSMYVNVVVGHKTTRMVVDSGASLICLPARIAAELGVAIPPNAPQMELVVANGDRIGARGVILPRVRIGEFEVENVDAAILDAAANSAEPLLGMSFLDHFKFEINAADRSLKMLRVKTE
ncbi:MAG TPA: TIGR02281 family clan AA aspartic protease [Rhodopirellula sp.]|nr:TIGR02281 family clan AA aspartic protease [Rhodopirellula sp.]